MITVVVMAIIGMLAAFWSGYWVGYVKREGKRPPVPFVRDIEEIVEQVTDRLHKEQSTPVNFYE